MKFQAHPCDCGNKDCQEWHVHPIATIPGTKFTEKQAQAIATLLSHMEEFPRARAIVVELKP